MLQAPRNLTVSWPVTPSSSDSHAYFDRMRALPTCIGALGLRNQAEIDAATASRSNALYRYIWPHDAHPEAQDGAKYTLPAVKPDGTVQASQPTNQKVQLSLDVSSGIVIVSWEFYFTKDWQRAFTPQSPEERKAWGDYKFKTFQITHPSTKIYFETRNHWARRRGDAYVSVADVRNYDMGADLMAACGVVNPTGYCPTGERAVPYRSQDDDIGSGGFDVPVSQWLRYYKEVRLGVDASEFTSWNRWRPMASGYPPWTGPITAGRYNMLSEYIAGETFDPMCLLDRVPAVHKVDASGSDLELGKFYFEMNTSAKITRHGDAIAYGRNIVAWRAERGLAEDPSPLARPVR